MAPARQVIATAQTRVWCESYIFDNSHWSWKKVPRERLDLRHFWILGRVGSAAFLVLGRVQTRLSVHREVQPWPEIERKIKKKDLSSKSPEAMIRTPVLWTEAMSPRPSSPHCAMPLSEGWMLLGFIPLQPASVGFRV